MNNTSTLIRSNRPSSDTIASKLSILTHRMQNGYSMKPFCTEGIGLQTALEEVGRLTDFKGVFVIVDDLHLPIVLGESDRVISELLKLAKGIRVQDQDLLKKIASRYGFNTALAGQEYLKSMQVNWIEG